VNIGGLAYIIFGGATLVLVLVLLGDWLPERKSDAERFNDLLSRHEKE